MSLRFQRYFDVNIFRRAPSQSTLYIVFRFRKAGSAQVAH